MPLPEFEPKVLLQILQDMANYVRITAPELTDWNVGSRIRSLLECAAVEDDDQYRQMALIARQANIANLTGALLDEAATAENLYRAAALPAVGSVLVRNRNLVTSFLTEDLPVGASSMVLRSSRGFPSAGFPVTVRIGEGTATVEDVAITANNVGTGTLTINPVTMQLHAKEDRVSLVSGGALLVPAGTQIQVPASSTTAAQTATTLQAATIAAGNYDSALIPCRMNAVGLRGQIAAQQITQFVGSPPFDGAAVTNPAAFSGGADLETDAQFRARITRRRQALPRSTRTALEQLVVGQTYTDSVGIEYRIVSARAKELYSPTSTEDIVLLYIWPGTFDFVRVTVAGVYDFTLAALEGQRFFRFPHTALLHNSARIAVQPSGAIGYVALVRGIGYFLNEGTGDLQVAEPGLSQGDALRATQYSYYTDLIAHMQQVVDGALRDPVTYPGIRAAGVKVLVVPPTPRRMDAIRLSIVVDTGFSQVSVSAEAAAAVRRYVQQLGVGDQLVIAEMIAAVMAVDGVRDVAIFAPTENIQLLDDQIIDPSTLDIIVSA